MCLERMRITTPIPHLNSTASKSLEVTMQIICDLRCRMIFSKTLYSCGHFLIPQEEKRGTHRPSPFLHLRVFEVTAHGLYLISRFTMTPRTNFHSAPFLHSSGSQARYPAGYSSAPMTSTSTNLKWVIPIHLHQNPTHHTQPQNLSTQLFFSSEIPSNGEMAELVMAPG